MLRLSSTAEADKSAAEPSAEAAAPAPAPSPDSSEDKPKDDAVEQSPPAPVEPSGGEKTDDEGVASNKTSVESLKEANENNSNNADFSWIRGWYLNHLVQQFTAFTLKTITVAVFVQSRSKHNKPLS